MQVAWRIDWINWPIHSQQTSRRNALRALGVVQQRRLEREDTERYLATLSPVQSPARRR